MLRSLPLLDFYEARHQRLCDAIQKGSRADVDAFFDNEIIRLEELNKDQQFMCWSSVRHPEMVVCLKEKGFNFDVIDPSDQAALLGYGLRELSVEVVEALLDAGARPPNIVQFVAASRNQKLVERFRPDLVDLFFETIEVDDLFKITWLLIDEEAFKMMRERFNFQHASSVYNERLRAFWFLTCKFKYVDTAPDSFFTKLVFNLFYKKTKKESETLVLMAKNTGNNEAVKYLAVIGYTAETDPP